MHMLSAGVGRIRMSKSKFPYPVEVAKGQAE